MERPKAILFDLDCTLTDRMASLEQYAGIFVDHFAAKLSGCSQSEVRICFAEVDEYGYIPRPRCWAHLQRKLSWKMPASHAEMDELWHSRWPDCAVGISGLAGLLEKLAAATIDLGIITNGPAIGQNQKIDRLGIRPWMKVILVSKQVGLAKPHRAIFERACAMLARSAGEIWFVGDHPINDMIGARQAGMLDIWVRGYQPWPENFAPPAVTIDHPGELLKMLEL